MASRCTHNPTQVVARQQFFASLSVAECEALVHRSLCRETRRGETLFREAPERYQCATWLELNDGMDLAEYIERVGLLRSDGKTLVGQPHLRTDEKSLWTIDDIRRLGIEIRDPLRDVDASTLPVIG